jgi:hypothetical protein
LAETLTKPQPGNKERKVRKLLRPGRAPAVD